MPSDPLTDAAAMALALAQARHALAHGDVPVGAVALVDGRPVAARHNERELIGDPTAHAEVLALRDAAQALGRVATVDGHPGGDARTLRHVRRGAGGGAGGTAGLRGVRSPRPGPAEPSTTCAATLGSTTSSP